MFCDGPTIEVVVLCENADGTANGQGVTSTVSGPNCFVAS
jgi:hypothetical protein